MSEQDRPRCVRVGQHVVNLDAVASCHWEGSKLFVHLAGGRFLSFVGTDAHLLWDAICRGTLDLRTGELLAG